MHVVPLVILSFPFFSVNQLVLICIVASFLRSVEIQKDENSQKNGMIIIIMMMMIMMMMMMMMMMMTWQEAVFKR